MQFVTWILIDTLFFLDSTRFDIESIYHPQALDAGNLLFCRLAFFPPKLVQILVNGWPPDPPSLDQPDYLSYHRNHIHRQIPVF